MQPSKTSLRTEFEPTTSCVDGYSGKHAGGTYSYHCALKGQDKDIRKSRPPVRQSHFHRRPSVYRRSQCTAFASIDGYIFRDITLRSLLKRNTSFGAICRLHLHGRRASQARKRHDAGSKQALLPTRLRISSTLKTEAKCSSETSVCLQRAELFFKGGVSQKQCVCPSEVLWDVPPCNLVNSVTELFGITYRRLHHLIRGPRTSEMLSGCYFSTLKMEPVYSFETVHTIWRTALLIAIDGSSGHFCTSSLSIDPVLPAALWPWCPLNL
jgi:hypothetical protein